MTPGRMARLFAIFCAVAALLIVPMYIISTIRERNERASQSPAPTIEPEVARFVLSNKNGVITSCHFAGPFDVAPKVEELGKPLVGAPATSDTVWQEFFGWDDVIELSSVVDPLYDGDWWVFDVYLAVRPEKKGMHHLLINSMGEAQISIDGKYFTTVEEQPSEWFNRFEAPGEFSEVARRLSVAVKARFGKCGMQMLLSSYDRSSAVESMSLMQWASGLEPTNEDIASRAIAIDRMNDGMLDDKGGSVEVYLAGGLPYGFDFVDLKMTAKWDDGRTVEKLFPAHTLSQYIEFKVGAPEKLAPMQEMVVILEVNGKKAATRKLKWYAPLEVLAAEAAVTARYDKIVATKGNDADLALRRDQFLVAIDTIKRQPEYPFFGLEEAVIRSCEILDEFNRVADWIESGIAPYTGETSQHERGYFSNVDGSPQPFKVFLPPDYFTDQRTRPVVILLHGYVSSYTIAEWGEGMLEFARCWHRHGAIVVQPFGRSNTDFQTVGETDVIEVTDLVLQKYNGDPRRVYLFGLSMGGMGTWSIGARYPGKYAALIGLAGRTDWYFWHKKLPEDLMPHQNYLVRSWNPVDLLLSFRNQNIFILQGNRDTTVDPAHASRFSEVLKKNAIPHSYEELNGDHMSIFRRVKDRELNDEVATVLRVPGDKVSYRAFFPMYAKSRWLSTPLFAEWGKPVEATGEVEGNRVTVTVENAMRVVIKPEPGLLFPGSRVEVAINGVEHPPVELPAEGLVFDLIKVPAGLLKTPELSGPVWQITMRPFAIVYGSESDKEKAESLALWWRKFAKGKARMFSAAEVTDAVAQQYSLILVGTPSTNSYLASVADSLPITITDSEFVLPNGEKYAAKDRGLMMLYPNPKAPANLLLVCSGGLYGVQLPVNHRLDMVPDYLVYEPVGDSLYDTEDKVLAGGFFDECWKFAPRLHDKAKEADERP